VSDYERLRDEHEEALMAPVTAMNPGPVDEARVKATRNALDAYVYALEAGNERLHALDAYVYRLKDGNERLRDEIRRLVWANEEADND
jgi:uncharacterized protein YdcH (DUF465 family)